MSKITFTKYHGTGNDFIILDHRDAIKIDINDHGLIQRMCSRRFGIGADGLMIVENSKSKLDFDMRYYNSDGNLSSMCGNGGRCITHFFMESGLRLAAGRKCVQFGFQGDIYEACLLENEDWISLKMQDLSSVSRDGKAYVLDTGSPHYVSFYKDLDRIQVARDGAAIRNNETYTEVGINVNFCRLQEKELVVRTFERGVEDETYSCGTGVVASAISLVIDEDRADGKHVIDIDTLGGKLRVRLVKKSSTFSEIYLEGPAKRVFQGEYETLGK